MGNSKSKKSPRIVKWIELDYYRLGNDYIIKPKIAYQVSVCLDKTVWVYEIEKNNYEIQTAKRMHDLGKFRFKDWNVIKTYGKLVDKWKILDIN